VACANLAGLSFAWVSWRRREIAVRVALGAGPGRIVSQLLAEAFVLAVVGGTLGVVLAAAGLPLILRLNPGAVPRFGAVSVNGASLLFAVAISLLAGLAVGQWPALAAVRPAMLALLGDEGGGGRRETTPVRWMGALLIGFEVAAAFVLLTGAGLSLRGLFRLAAVDPGFRSEERMTARVSLPEESYGLRGQSLFFSALAERLRLNPRFSAVGVLSTLPTHIDRIALDYSVLGGAAGPPAQKVSFVRAVTPGTLAALGVPLVAGREITVADGPEAPPVAMVN